MTAPAEERKGFLKHSDGKVVIGKNIPLHWGKSQIVAWEVHDESAGMIESYKTKKEACIMFYYLKHANKNQTSLKICPLLEYEGAVMNPYAVDWNDCFIPIEEDMKPPNGMTWKVKGWSQEKSRWITCGQLQSQEIRPFELRKIANNDPKIIAKQTY